ncbi:MAG: isoprenyl transferase [Selenomonadaceae bacterium]
MFKKILNNFQKGNTAKDTNDNKFADIKIDASRLPRHTAIIMDGNGRWAESHGLIRTAGHTQGVRTLKEILKIAIDLPLPVLTVFAFSTENWKRPHAEVDFLMHLFSDYLAEEINEIDEKNVKLHFLGRIDELSLALRNQARDAEKQTMNNTGLIFNVAMNYGGQDEITRAVQKIAAEIESGKIKSTEIDSSYIENNLDTAGLPPVDLLIRTSGDFRISNFLLWQAAYAEFWFTDVNWPEFTPEVFMKAISDYGKRDRRFGGLTDKK